MAATATTQKGLANLLISGHDFDPDSTNKTQLATYLDMRDHEWVVFMFQRTVGTGNLDTFDIVGNTASDGSGTDRIIVSKTISSEPNLVGDYVFLECSAGQIKEIGVDNGEDLRFVSFDLEFATNTDEAAVTAVRGGSKFPRRDLSADTIA